MAKTDRGAERQPLTSPEDGAAPRRAAAGRELPLRQRAIDRALTDRYAVAAGEVGELVEATFRVIAEQGTVEPRVGEIVAASGLSRQVFYRHFRSKDELMVVVLDEGRRMLADYLHARMARCTDPLDQIHAWIAGFIRQAQDPRAAERTRPFGLMAGRLASQFPEEYGQAQKLLVALLIEPINAAVAAGTAVSTDPERDAQAIHELVSGTMNRFLVANEFPTDDDLEALSAFVFRAIGAEPAPRVSRPSGKRAAASGKRSNG